MPNLLIQNGLVIDPSQGMDRLTNLLVADGGVALASCQCRLEHGQDARATLREDTAGKPAR